MMHAAPAVGDAAATSPALMEAVAAMAGGRPVLLLGEEGDAVLTMAARAEWARPGG